MERSGLRILVVDDEPIPRNFAARLLASVGEVVVASDPGEALRCLDLGRIDLVVTDGEMPGMGGAGLIVEVRQRWPDVPCMMVSGNISPERRKWLESCGIPYLEKPYRAQALLEAVQRSLDLPPA